MKVLTNRRSGWPTIDCPLRLVSDENGALPSTQSPSRVNRGDTSPAPASRFDPFQRVVEMHLIERAFGQIYDYSAALR